MAGQRRDQAIEGQNRTRRQCSLVPLARDRVAFLEAQGEPVHAPQEGEIPGQSEEQSSLLNEDLGAELLRYQGI